jgi:hypothetical protein
VLLIADLCMVAASLIAMSMPCSCQSADSFDAAVVRARQRNRSCLLLRTQPEMNVCESSSCWSAAGCFSCRTACITQRMMGELRGVPASRIWSSASTICCSAPGAASSAGQGPMPLGHAAPSSSSSRCLCVSVCLSSNHDATVVCERRSNRSSGASLRSRATVRRAA